MKDFLKKNNLQEGCVKEENLIDIDIPIEKVFYKDDKYIYKASFGMFDGVESIEKWKKKYPLNYIDYINKNTVRLGSGTRKDYNMPMICYSVYKIVFYCIGEQVNIEKLLEKINFIGKKSSQGYGKVKKWEIKRVNKEGCLWYKRQLPAIKLFEKYLDFKKESHIRQIETTCRPPYWARKNLEVCYV